MIWFNVGGYIQVVKELNITCTCQWGSLYPDNYKEGKKVCKHIIKVMEKVDDNRNKQTSI